MATEQFKHTRVVTAVTDASGRYQHKDVPKYDVNCLMCNAAIRVTPSRLTQKFCSPSCRHDSLSPEFRGHTWQFKPEGDYACACCGKACHAKPSRKASGRGKFCSKTCYVKMHPSKMDPTRCSWYGKPRVYTLYAPYTDRLGREFRFRSSYEIAFVQQYLDRLELTWEYEPRTFDVFDSTYTPDFWIEEQQTFVEVKGYIRPKEMAKLTSFVMLYPDVEFRLATDDVLVTEFGLDLTKAALESIRDDYKVCSFTRRSERGKMVA